MFVLVRTSHFDRRLARFIRIHSELRLRLAQTFRALEEDPFLPSLRLHRLGGDLSGLQAARVAFDYRIALTLRLDAGEIVLLDIGSHDEVYGR